MKFVDALAVVKPEPEIGIKLEFKPNGDVNLVAIEECGTIWYIVKLNKDGVLKLQSSIPARLGFKLIDGGYIKTEKI